MSTAVQASIQPVARAGRAPHPSFAGAVRAELLKIRRQRANLVMLGVGAIGFGILMLTLAMTGSMRTELSAAVVRTHGGVVSTGPVAFFYHVLEALLGTFQAGAGIALLIISARLVAMEYSAGTIRILLSRGFGRLHLLGAKLVGLALVGVAMLIAFMVLAVISITSVILAWGDSATWYTALPASAWHDLELALLTALISIGACILVGVTAGVVGRSLAFGLGAAMAFFPADNFATGILSLLATVTHNKVWAGASAYLLGPNLNQLPHELVGRIGGVGQGPVVPVDATHCLIVIGTFAAGFLAVCGFLTWRRDVLE
ncbi:MAG: ABC transporter permease subunit [Candidatus Dormibacteraceae bacterium]